MIKTYRSSETFESRKLALLSLTGIKHYPGQLVQALYWLDSEHTGVSSIFAIGVKEGTGTDCFEVVSLGSLEVVVGIGEELIDVSALVHGEIFLWKHDGKLFRVLKGSQSDSRKIEEVKENDAKFLNLGDGYTWYLKAGKLYREDESPEILEVGKSFEKKLADFKETAVSEVKDEFRHTLDELNSKVAGVISLPPSDTPFNIISSRPGFTEESERIYLVGTDIILKTRDTENNIVLTKILDEGGSVLKSVYSGTGEFKREVNERLGSGWTGQTGTIKVAGASTSFTIPVVDQNNPGLLGSAEYNLLRPFLEISESNPEILKGNLQKLGQTEINSIIESEVQNLGEGDRDWRVLKAEKANDYRLEANQVLLPAGSMYPVLVFDKFTRSWEKETEENVYRGQSSNYILALRVVDSEIKEIGLAKLGQGLEVASINTKWKTFDGSKKEDIEKAYLFVDVKTQVLYLQNEPGHLKDLSSGFTHFGETEGTSFEGNRGKALETTVHELDELRKKRVKKLTANNTEELKAAILGLTFDEDTDKDTDVFIGTDDVSTRVSKYNYIKDLGQIRVVHVIFSVPDILLLERIWDTGNKTEVSNSGWQAFGGSSVRSLAWENGKLVLKNNGTTESELTVPIANGQEGGTSGLISGTDIKKLWPILDPNVDQDKLKKTLTDLAQGKVATESGSLGGNTININDIQDGTYTLESAVSVVPRPHRKPGKKITFRTSSGNWQTWTFTGDSWEDIESWQRSEVAGINLSGKTYEPGKNGTIELPRILTIKDLDNVVSGTSINPVSSKAVHKKIEDTKAELGTTLFYNEEESKLVLRNSDGRDLSFVILPKGTASEGGTVSSSFVVDVNLITENGKVIKSGSKFPFKFSWRHYNSSTNRNTSYTGRIDILVNGTPVVTKDSDQGEVEVEIGKFLSNGENKVVARVTTADKIVEQSRTLNVTVAILSLTSEFNLSDTIEKGTVLPFRYIAHGSGNKTINFEVDRRSLGESTVISTSGAVSIRNIDTTGLSHGSHHIKATISREIGSETIHGTSLETDFIVIEPGNTTPIIATEVTEISVPQYETVSLPFSVYSQESVNNTVEVWIGEEKVSTLEVGRNKSVFNWKVLISRDFQIKFKVGQVQKVVNVSVQAAETQVNLSKDGLEVYLKSSGQSNSSTSKDVWEWKTVRAQFNDKVRFDNTSGWIVDRNGHTSLHLSKGGSVEIPYQPFKTDAKLGGRTIELEFKVSGAVDLDTPLISCFSGNIGFQVTAQECFLTSAQGKTVSTKFKQDERIRTSFVISTNGFMYLFLNGELCGVIKYTDTDYFVQSDPSGIRLGDISADLDVYNIAVYSTPLSFRQIVNNYISTLDDTTKMVEKIKSNSIVNEDTGEEEIEYTKVVGEIPCMTVIGTLPTYKGDKKTVKIVYEDTKRPEFSFVCDKMQIDVQGTSSQYYPRKNWKIKSKSGFLSSLTGKTSSKYALHGVDGKGKDIEMKPVKTFCMKADFAESSGTHNTGAANFINEVLVKSGILTPPQKVDKTVRTTVYGFPCLMFHQEDETGKKVFIGKYNFNNDKSTQDVFGFENIKGYNKGMVVRDSWLSWSGTAEELKSSMEATDNAKDGDEYFNYLIQKPGIPENNHIYAYENRAWVDKGEMWRWDFENRCWRKNDGQTTKDGLGKSGLGELVENNVECWEFTNNGNAMGLFHSSDFTGTVTGSDIPSWLKTKWLKNSASGDKQAPYWTTAFEPRYPDCDDQNKIWASGKEVPKQLKAVVEWLRSVDTSEQGLSDGEIIRREAEFKKNYTKYFHKDTLLAYDLIREGLLMADQGAKNVMWAFFDGLCYPIFYDNDTILGLNNEGRNQFSPYSEPHSRDKIGKFVFNGESSVVWSMIEKTSEKDKDLLYQTLVASGDFTYERALYWFNTRQSDMWSETVYNLDSKFKYIDSFGIAGQGNGVAQDYLDIAQGSREEHRKWMLYERFSYLNSKRASGEFRSNFVHLRANTAGSSSVPHEVSVTVTAAQDWYFGFRFSGNAGFTSRFIGKDQSYKFTAPPGSSPNDTECYVHQADRIKDLGDLSKLYPSTLVLTECKRLKRLTVGNETPGYIGKLATLTLGEHPDLEEINIANCPNLTSVLDLSGCPRIKRVEAVGSRIRGIKLPAGSSIEYLSLPSTVTSLDFSDLHELTSENLKIENYSVIESINVSGKNKINSLNLINNAIISDNSSLKYVRVEGIEVTGDGRDILSLAKRGLKGVKNREGKAEIIGKYEVVDSKINSLDLEVVNREFPQLTVRVQDFGYTVIECDLNSDLADRFSNLDNQTGYKFPGKPYKPSGHIKKILDNRIPCILRKAEEEGEFYACKLNRDNFLEYEDGHEVFTYYRYPGSDGEYMIYEPTYYYKGINDYINKRMYYVYSYSDSIPSDESTASIKVMLSDISEVWGRSIIDITNISVGSLFNVDTYIRDSRSGYSQYYVNAKEEVVSKFKNDIVKYISGQILYKSDFVNYAQLSPTDSMGGLEIACAHEVNVYKLGIPEGSKLFRWPTKITRNLAIFVNSSNEVLKIVTTTFPLFSHSAYLGVEEGDYLFTEIPEGATSVYFQSPSFWWRDTTARKYCIFSKSRNIVSIEPEWVRHEGYLASIFATSFDGTTRNTIGSRPYNVANRDLPGFVDRYKTIAEYNREISPSDLDKIYRNDTSSVFQLDKGVSIQTYEEYKDHLNLCYVTLGSNSIVGKIGSGNTNEDISYYKRVSDLYFAGTNLKDVSNPPFDVRCYLNPLSLGININSVPINDSNSLFPPSGIPINRKDPYGKSGAASKVITGDGSDYTRRNLVMCLGKIVYLKDTSVLSGIYRGYGPEHGDQQTGVSYPKISYTENGVKKTREVHVSCELPAKKSILDQATIRTVHGLRMDVLPAEKEKERSNTYTGTSLSPSRFFGGAFRYANDDVYNLKYSNGYNSSAGYTPYLVPRSFTTTSESGFGITKFNSSYKSSIISYRESTISISTFTNRLFADVGFTRLSVYGKIKWVGSSREFIKLGKELTYNKNV